MAPDALPNDLAESSTDTDGDTTPAGRRSLWWGLIWRLVGLVTLCAAVWMADTVWKVNRHVSRMELARIFATAMSRPRTPPPPRPVVQDRPARPVRRPKPVPTTQEAPPFSMDPTDWINPGTSTGQPPAPEPEPAPPPPPPEAPPEPLPPVQESMRETQVSEVTRQTWTLLCLVMLECVALAGVSAMLDMRRARGNLLVAAWLLLLGTGLTAVAAYVVTNWGGFPRLPIGDYIRVVWRGIGLSLLLFGVLILPQSRRHARALRVHAETKSAQPGLARAPFCGLLLAVLAIVCAAAALLGDEFALPAWHIIRWVLVGWSIPAALLGMIVCTGRRGVLLAAYAVALVGLTVQFVCWGLPFAAIGPPAALRTLLKLLPIHLIALGRLHECLRWTPKDVASIAAED